MKPLLQFTIFIAIFLIYAATFAQKVTVYDNATLQPVESVIIQDLGHSQSSLTNTGGVARLDMFTSSDTLIFEHTSYLPYIITLKNLAVRNYRIGMSERIVKLQEVVVSGSKWEENKEEVPSKIVTIQSKQIAFDNPQTTADLLGNTGEVFIQKSQQGGGSPMIRGFSANSVLIVMDGIRLNNAIYRSGNLHNIISLDPNAIENAEVIYGPGSVLYGSDALGGVMDFHTFTPNLAFDGGNVASANFMARYASANNERTGHLRFNIGWKKWGMLTSVTTSYFDDLRMGSIMNDSYLRKEYAGRIDGRDAMITNDDPRVQKFSGYEQFNLMQKIRFRPNDHLDLEYAFHYSRSSDNPRYDRLIEYQDDSTLKYARWYYGPAEWMMHSLQAQVFQPTRLFNNARIIISFQDYQESRNSRRFGNDGLRVQREHVLLYALNADFDKEFSSRSFLFYGIEAVYNDVRSTAFKENINTGMQQPEGTRYPDGTNHYYSLAAYLDFKHNFTQNLTFLAGARYTFVGLNSTLTEENVYELPYDKIDLETGAMNGSAGIAYRPGRGWQFNLNAATGFRAPNLDDVAKVFDSEPGKVVVPNPDLKPEYTWNIDLGFNKKIGEKAEVDLVGFYTWLTDAIVRRDYSFNGIDSIIYMGELSRVQAMVNADRAFIYGLNATFRLDISSMFAFESYLTWARGEDNEGNALRHVAPLYGSSSLIFRKSSFKAELAAVYNGEIPYERLAPSERGKIHMYATDGEGNPYSPAWWTLNLKTSYQMTAYLGLDLGIENMLDHRYRPYSSGIAAPGRNFYISLRGRL